MKPVAAFLILSVVLLLAALYKGPTQGWCIGCMFMALNGAMIAHISGWGRR
jgi:hypothetical protein